MWWIGIVVAYLAPQVLSDCKTYPIHNVDLKQMSGMWYLHYKSSDAKELYPDYKCMRNYYSANPDGQTIDFVEAILLNAGERTWEGKSFYTTMTKKEDGTLNMKIIDPKVGEVDLPSYILDTDYTSFLITYVCNEKIQGTYIMSRDRTSLNGISVDKVNEALSKAKLSMDKFTITSQASCP